MMIINSLVALLMVYPSNDTMFGWCNNLQICMCIMDLHTNTVQRESLANFTVMSVWRGKVWRMDGFSHKVIIISKNLDGFSLANHG